MSVTRHISASVVGQKPGGSRRLSTDVDRGQHCSVQPVRGAGLECRGYHGDLLWLVKVLGGNMT